MMKSKTLYFLLLLMSSACASNAPIIPDNVASWSSISPDSFNQKIKQAYQSKQKWASRPELYIFNLFELGELMNLSYKYNADNIEDPKNINIAIVRDGFLDDSVRGDIHTMKLIKNENNTWTFTSIKKAINCWRSEQQTYSSKACP